MSIAESINSLKRVDLSELDLNNLGSWPPVVKVITCILLLIIALALGYNFYLKDLQTILDQQRSGEQTLKNNSPQRHFRLPI